jgi:hypothetical protein
METKGTNIAVLEKMLDASMPIALWFREEPENEDAARRYLQECVFGRSLETLPNWLKTLRKNALRATLTPSCRTALLPAAASSLSASGWERWRSDWTHTVAPNLERHTRAVHI